MVRANNIIGRFNAPGGVRVEIDSSLLWLVGLIVYFSLGSGLVGGLIFVAVLVGSILLHELGHAWGSIVQGVPVKRVVLYGGGGFCERRATPTYRSQELIVAMGPIVNIAIWALGGIAIWGLFWGMAQAGPGGYAYLGGVSSLMGFLSLLAGVNLALFLFNMVPVQPLDGGKLLHLALLRFMPADQAMRVTGAVGYVLSILWIPGMIVFFLTYGWVLFFMPSIKDHKAMMQGRAMAPAD